MSLFGATRVGYVVVESKQLARWRELLEEGLGLCCAHADENELAFRLEGHERRIVVRYGPAEDVVAVGLQARGETIRQALLDRLRARGIAVAAGAKEVAKSRGVGAFDTVLGPKALPLELFTEADPGDEPLDMLASGFVTGEGGLGHVVFTSKHPDEMQRFWCEIFDARVSDRVSQSMSGVMVDILFLRLNQRHHSIAIAATRGLRLDPMRTKVQHVNLEAATLDDVTAAFARCRHLGFQMAREIGQHPNDRQISFYVQTPSGFEIELGCQARTVDEASWQPASYDAISVWGHGPGRGSPFRGLAENAENFGRGLRSLLHAEYSPLGRERVK